MPLHDTGDLVKGLGFVALYAAYVEEAIDKCVALMAGNDVDHIAALQRKNVSTRIKYLVRALGEPANLPEELQSFPGQLGYLRTDLLEWRNAVIHGRVYALPDGDVRFSARPGVEQSPATSAEVFHLANLLMEAQTLVNGVAMFALPRLLASRGATAGQ